MNLLQFFCLCSQSSGIISVLHYAWPCFFKFLLAARKQTLRRILLALENEHNPLEAAVERGGSLCLCLPLPAAMLGLVFLPPWCSLSSQVLSSLYKSISKRTPGSPLCICHLMECIIRTNFKGISHWLEASQDRSLQIWQCQISLSLSSPEEFGMINMDGSSILFSNMWMQENYTWIQVNYPAETEFFHLTNV